MNFLWQDYLTFQLISVGPDEKADTKDDVKFTHQPPVGKRGWFGNAFDMVAEGVMAPMARMKMAMPMLQEKEEFRLDKDDVSGTGGSADKKQVRIRKYFPETLFFNAAILTDPNGIANISLQMADSSLTCPTKGACMRISAPVDRTRRIACCAASVSISAGWLK